MHAHFWSLGEIEGSFVDRPWQWRGSNCRQEKFLYVFIWFLETAGGETPSENPCPEAARGAQIHQKKAPFEKLVLELLKVSRHHNMIAYFFDFLRISGPPEGPHNFRKIAKIPNQGLLERPLRQKSRKKEVSEGGPILDPVLEPFLNGFWMNFMRCNDELFVNWLIDVICQIPFPFSPYKPTECTSSK